MAKSNKNKSKSTEGSTGTRRKDGDDDFAVPDGFDVNVGRERGEGWIVKEEGNIVQGKLLGRQTYKTKRGKTRAFYQIELEKPCLCEVENPDFNEEADEDETNVPRIRETLEEGAIVNIDEFKKLEDLAPYCKDGGQYGVWFVIGPKVDIGDDQTMWSLAAGPRLRVDKKPTATPF